MYLTHAPPLIDAGYAPLALIPRSKIPGICERGSWRRREDWPTAPVIDPRLDAESRESVRNANVGLILGPRSKDVVRVDIDAATAQEQAALLAALPHTDIRNRGSRGEGLFYTCPGAVTTQFRIGGRLVVEVLGAGRQTVLPPSTHPDTGKPYAWTGAKTLLDEAPPSVGHGELIGIIKRVLAPFGYAPEAPTSAVNNDTGSVAEAADVSPWRALNDAALENLDAWVSALQLFGCIRRHDGSYTAVATWRPSSTGRPTEKRKRNLGIDSKGIKDFGTGKPYSPIDLVMAALGLDFTGAADWLDERLGWAGGGPEIRLEAPGVGKDESGPEEPPTAGGPEEPAAPDALEALTHNLPGLMGEIVDWVLATAIRPNRVVAMATAVITIGTLIGRRAAVGPYRSGSHLYLVVVGPTGIGKQHALNTVERLIKAAGADAHLGAEMSAQSGVENILRRSAAALCLMDEFGAFLRRILSPKASGWEAGVGKNLLSLWGTNFNIWRSVEWAGKPSEKFYAPSLSILGATTPEKFASVLQGESARDGLISRMLALRANVRQSLADPELDPLVVPESLVDRLRTLYRWTGMGSLLQVGDGNAEIVPHVVPWEPAAKKCFFAFADEIEQHIEANRSDQPYMERCAEQALRLAMIRAVGGSGCEATVTLEDIGGCRCEGGGASNGGRNSGERDPQQAHRDCGPHPANGPQAAPGAPAI